MSYKKLTLVGVGLFLLGIGISNIAPFVAKTHADTPSSFTWQDAKTITDSTNNTYKYTKVAQVGTSSYGAVFVAQRNDGGCTVATGGSLSADNLHFNYKDYNYGGASAVIMILGDSKTYPTDGTFKVGTVRNFQYLSFTAPTNAVADAGCQGAAQGITVSNPSNASAIRFNWVDSQTITDISNGWIYKNSNSSDKNLFYLGSEYNTKSSGGVCFSWMKELSPSLGEYHASQLAKPGTSGWTPPQNGSNCWTKEMGNYPLGQSANIKIPGSADSGTPSTDDTNGQIGTAPEINCAVHLWNPLSWFLCPLASALEAVVSGLDNQINNYLDITPGQGSYTSACQTNGSPRDQWCNYYKPWGVIRNISIGLIVIFVLIAIISQALGFEIFDAYTLRKTLPRVLVAVIGIALSWPLMMFFINLINALGIGVRGLIYAPFAGSKVALGGGGQFVSSFFIGGAIAALGFAGLLSFVATAALAVALAFLVLTLRQMLIVMLVIFAPIAIACYVLPNTQKVWKLWWDSFSKGLLMFPIIAAFIAIGRVFAAVNSTDAEGINSINQIIAFTAYFAPYFLIPFAFRLAGGAISTIGGLVNDRGRGAFDRLKKYRGNKIAGNMHDMSAGTRFNNKGLNALTARATTARLGFGAKGREAYDNKMQLAAADFAKSGRGISTQFKDNVLQAKTYGSEAEARRRMAHDFLYKYDSHGNITNQAEADRDVNRAIDGAKASGGFGASQQVWATKQLAATGTGYTNEAQMLATIARVAGNNDVLADSMWGEMRGLTERAGRSDMKAGYSTGSALLANIRKANQAGGTALTAAQLENDTTPGGFADQLTNFGVDAGRGVDNMSLMGRGKAKGVSNIVKQYDRARARAEAQLRTRQLVRMQVNHETDEVEWVGTGIPLTEEELAEARTTLGQVRAKLENMKDFTSYGPEVNAAALDPEATAAAARDAESRGGAEAAEAHARERSTRGVDPNAGVYQDRNGPDSD